jgi:hypothetical protein
MRSNAAIDEAFPVGQLDGEWGDQSEDAVLDDSTT